MICYTATRTRPLPSDLLLGLIFLRLPQKQTILSLEISEEESMLIAVNKICFFMSLENFQWSKMLQLEKFLKLPCLPTSGCDSCRGHRCQYHQQRGQRQAGKSPHLPGIISQLSWAGTDYGGSWWGKCPVNTGAMLNPLGGTEFPL